MTPPMGWVGCKALWDLKNVEKDTLFREITKCLVSLPLSSFSNLQQWFVEVTREQ